MDYRGLLENIEEKRVQMIDLGIRYGFVAEQTITVSRELDSLIIIYQKQTLEVK